RKGGTGELRQAEAAFAQVEALGRADGALNAARVYLREGRLDEAAVALNRAGAFDPPAPAWSLLYFGGLVNAQYGQLEAAIENFTRLVETDFSSGEQRLDFSRDYRLLDSLAEALTTHARDERTDPEKRDEFLGRARDVYLQALVLDPERASSHYGLAQVYALLGDTERSEEQYRLHDRYRIDDNARDRAVAAARRSDAAADHAAEPVVIYDLQRTAGP
ncbi:MAG: tetratricopeptide repeat protein, partial [Gammaproteobacteria bacterium]